MRKTFEKTGRQLREDDDDDDDNNNNNCGEYLDLGGTR